MHVLWMYSSKCSENIWFIRMCMGLWHNSNRCRWLLDDCIIIFRRILCRKLVFVVQLLLSHCRFGTLAAFMVTTPATRVSFGGDFCSLLVTRWDSLSGCDAHDCIAYLLTGFGPWDEVIILMLYAIYKWSQINPSWVSDSQCDCTYVLAYYK